LKTGQIVRFENPMLRGRFLQRFRQNYSSGWWILFGFSRGFSSALMVNLEVAAAQTFECADDDFCQAQVPALPGVLWSGSSESAPAALLF
jgi:hypothetical protein